MKTSLICLVFLSSLIFLSCLSVPEGVEPVKDFELERYLGKWYEIARLDHKFERGLDEVTAEYSLMKNGKIRVLNRGYLGSEGRWKEAEGRASFAGPAGEGFLKVSFFGPFYGSYVIFELDRENYEYAFVSGPDRSYLWLLARNPHPGKDVIERFIMRAASLGFDTENLIFPKHQ